MTLAHLKPDGSKSRDKLLAASQNALTPACVSPLGRWRRLQFSIRDLLLLMLIVSIVCSAVRTWWTSRLDNLVDAFNESLDKEEYAQAIGLAEKAAWLYPDDPVAKGMSYEARCIRKVQEGKELSADEVECLGYADADGAADTGIPSLCRGREDVGTSRARNNAKPGRMAEHRTR